MAQDPDYQGFYQHGGLHSYAVSDLRYWKRKILCCACHYVLHVAGHDGPSQALFPYCQAIERFDIDWNSWGIGLTRIQAALPILAAVFPEWPIVGNVFEPPSPPVPKSIEICAVLTLLCSQLNLQHSYSLSTALTNIEFLHMQLVNYTVAHA